MRIPASGKPGSTQVVVGLFVPFGFDGFGLIIGIEDHVGKSTGITVFAPPSGPKHRLQAMGALARWRFAFESSLETSPRASQRR